MHKTKFLIIDNAMIFKKMGADDMFDGVFDEVPCYNGSLKYDFVLRLEKNIWNLKRVLFSRERCPLLGARHGKCC